jgi:hypothetical protein
LYDPTYGKTDRWEYFLGDEAWQDDVPWGTYDCPEGEDCGWEGEPKEEGANTHHAENFYVPYHIDKIEVKFWVRINPKSTLDMAHSGAVNSFKAWGIESCRDDEKYYELPDSCNR